MLNLGDAPLQESYQGKKPAPGPSSSGGPSRIEELKAVLPSIHDTVLGLKSKGGGEMAGPCPKCGGEDRFFVRADGSFACRQCGGKGGDAIDFHKWLNNTNTKGLMSQYLGDRPKPEKTPKQPKTPATDENLVKVYTYEDEAGADLFHVLRYEKPGHDKTFRQGHYNEAGQLVFSMEGVRRVLYRLPEVTKTDAVILVEGEKDADNLSDLGIVATTSPMGASNWKPEYAEFLKGKHVAVIPDNDGPGRKYEQAVLSSLVGVAESVRVVRLPGEGKDVTDWLEAGGIRDQLFDLIKKTEVVTAGMVAGESVRDRLAGLIVEGGYVGKIGNEEWLFINLMIKNQIVVFVAKSGGGKTTISFFFVAPYLVQHHDMTVFYFDLDSPASDHKRMFEHAGKVGTKFKWINPLTHGKGPEVIQEALEDFVKAGERLDDVVFFFDTLKKFIDMLDKKSVKPFFSLLRQLTSLGATIALLGHANKHRGTDGNLVFEGVGDVMSDSDALLFFERISNPDETVDITTICDPDKGAKVRGLYKPITFHIDKDRTVTMKQIVTPVPDFSPGNAKKDKLTEEDILEMVVDYLKDMDRPISQSAIVNAFQGEKVGVNRFRGVLNACAVPEIEAIHGQLYCTDGGTFNKKLYGVKR